MTFDPVIDVGSRDLRLRFPRADFTDTRVCGLVVSPIGTTAGDIEIRPWSEQRVVQWHREKERFDRVGWRIAWAIRKAGRSPGGAGLVQRVADRLCVPLLDPTPTSVMVTNCTFTGLPLQETDTYV